MSPENPNHIQDQETNTDLIAVLDRKTGPMSGGFNKLNEFHQLRIKGESVLPELLESLSSPDWWKLELIWTIAAEAGKPIFFKPEQAGIHAEVVETILQWAFDQGYLSEE